MGILAWIVLGERVNALQAVGMAVVIGALAVVVRSQSAPSPPTGAVSTCSN